nr:DnaJ domain-containing protein [Rubrivirga sp. SAORIC476]
MADARDPFRVLSLPYDAGPEDVRRAFRRLARQTHPDRGGSAEAFHPVRVAYGALAADLDGERRRWQAAPVASSRAPRSAGGLDPRTFPTCTVRFTRSRDGVRRSTYATERRPEGWRPGAAPPPGGTCVAQVEASGSAPAFGVWRVPLDERRFRCVFGPLPAGG